MNRRLVLSRLAGLSALLLSGSLPALNFPVPNPGAETVHAERPDRPADAGVWTSAQVRADFSRDTRVKRSGAASFHTVNHGRANAPASAAQSALFILSGAVVPELKYSITGYVRTEAVSGEAGFHVRLKSAKGWLDSEAQCDVISGTNDWTRITARFTAPAGATEYNLFLLVRHPGKAWFDDIAIRDNIEIWSVKTFATLTTEFRQLQDRAAAMPATVRAAIGNRLSAGAASAARLLAESRELRPDQDLPLAARRRFVDEAARLDRMLLRHTRALSMQRLAETAVAGTGYATGMAPSTLHVFIEDLPLTVQPAADHRLLAVRGETEATQLVILPLEADLENVRVAVSTLTGDTAVIPAAAVVVKPVGFVRTEVLAGANPYPREFDYLGWWPDPLLPNFPFAVKQGESQPVWIEVHVPRDIPAGTYRGRIEISPAGTPPSTLPLTVDVADVTLPETWQFRNLLSWHEDWATKFYGERWNDELHERFIQFLLERRINVISMYGNEPYATAENLIRFAKRGQNVLMLASMRPEARVKSSKAAALRQRLDAMVPLMKEAGLLDRCIVYGWDERGPEWYDEIRYCAELLLQEYNEMPLLSAGTDPTFGTDSDLAGLSNIMYCPTMPLFDPDKAALAKRNGNRMWWYETWWIIEDPLIRSRLIPWQSFKAGAEGFLFWCLNRFVGNDKPIIDPERPAIRTTWNPALDGGYENSTAMYVYPGRDGPVSSLRLENFRDGIEDYELLQLARKRLTELGGRDGIDDAVLEGLRGAITLNDAFIKDHKEYSRAPEVLAAQRRTLILALQTAGAIR